MAIHVSRQHKYNDMYGKRLVKRRATTRHVACPVCTQLFEHDFFVSKHQKSCTSIFDQHKDSVCHDTVGYVGEHLEIFPEVFNTELLQTTSGDDVTSTHDVVTSAVGSSSDNDDSESIPSDNADTDAALLRVPNYTHRGTQKYMLMVHDIERKKAAVSDLIKSQHASVVFWSAAQRGGMSGVQAQKFVDIVVQKKADFTHLPASLVTIRKQVEQVADQWGKRTAKVVTLPVSELDWHEHVCFVYHDTIQLIADLLQDPDVCGPDAAWKFKSRHTRNGRYRIFGDLCQGYWWEAMEMQIPAGTTLCPVILNTDETVMKFGGRAAQKPIYITVGNLPYASRTKDKGITLICSFPHNDEQTTHSVVQRRVHISVTTHPWTLLSANVDPTLYNVVCAQAKRFLAFSLSCAAQRFKKQRKTSKKPSVAFTITAGVLSSLR